MRVAYDMAEKADKTQKMWAFYKNLRQDIENAADRGEYIIEVNTKELSRTELERILFKLEVDGFRHDLKPFTLVVCWTKC